MSKHWELMEEILELTPVSMPVLKQLTKKYNQRHVGSDSNVINTLLNNNYLIEVPESSLFELDEFVQNIVSHLRYEHRLGLADEVRLYVEELQRLVNAVFTAIEDSDKDDLVRHLKSLEDLIKKINRNLNNNSYAIADIILLSKKKKSGLSLKKRYAEVLEAWDRYVQPIGEMIRMNSPFEQILDRLEKDLYLANETLSSKGSLISEKNYIDRISARVIAIRTTLKEHYTEAQEQLSPLVDSIRRNTVLTQGASLVLEAIAKNKLSKLHLEEFVAVVRNKDDNPFPGNPVIESYIAGIKSYEPRIIATAKPGLKRRRKPELVNLPSVIDNFQSCLPVDDLMRWLIKEYPGLASEEVIDLYFQISRNQKFASLERGIQEYETLTHFIKAQKVSVTHKEEESIV